MKLSKAIKKIQKSLATDPDYRNSWKANIAMSFKDVYKRQRKQNKKKYLNSQDIHEIANKAAVEFLAILCIQSPKNK